MVCASSPCGATSGIGDKLSHSFDDSGHRLFRARIASIMDYEKKGHISDQEFRQSADLGRSSIFHWNDDRVSGLRRNSLTFHKMNCKIYMNYILKKHYKRRNVC